MKESLFPLYYLGLCEFLINLFIYLLIYFYHLYYFFNYKIKLQFKNILELAQNFYFEYASYSAFHVKSCNLSGIDFCLWYDIGVKVHFFLNRYPAPLVKKLISPYQYLL